MAVCLTQRVACIASKFRSYKKPGYFFSSAAQAVLYASC